MKTILIFLSTLVLVSSLVHANVEEGEVKAEWLYTIIPYLEWKGKTSLDIKVCSVGREGVFSFLDEILLAEKSTAQGEGYVAINLVRKAASSSFEECNILYISLNEIANVRDILTKVKNKKILTISSIKNFASMGGGVEFVIRDGGVVLLVNEKPVRESNIIIDSELLGFAERLDK